MIDFVALGDQVIDSVPGLRCVPLAAPHCAALYRRRMEALQSSTADWLCFVDGGPDIVHADFVPAMADLAIRAEHAGVPIGYAAELLRGKPGRSQEFTLRGFIKDHQMIHHGVVCNVAALKSVPWPDGCYAWEMIAYGTLAQRGYVYDPVPRYDWRPDRYGARLWPSYQRGVINARRWFSDMPPVPHPGEE